MYSLTNKTNKLAWRGIPGIKSEGMGRLQRTRSLCLNFGVKTAYRVQIDYPVRRPSLQQSPFFGTPVFLLLANEQFMAGGIGVLTTKRHPSSLFNASSLLIQRLMPSISVPDTHARPLTSGGVLITLINVLLIVGIMAYGDANVADLGCTLHWLQKRHEQNSDSTWIINVQRIGTLYP